MLILVIIISLQIIIGLKAGIDNILLNEFKKLDIEVNLIVVPVILLIVYILNRIHSVHDTVLKKINPTTRAAETRAATTRAATTQAATIRAAETQAATTQAAETRAATTRAATTRAAETQAATTRAAIKYPHYPLLTPKLPDKPGCYWIAPTSCKQIPVPMNEWRYIQNSTKSGHINYELCREKFSHIEKICGADRVQIRYVPKTYTKPSLHTTTKFRSKSTRQKARPTINIVNSEESTDKFKKTDKTTTTKEGEGQFNFKLEQAPFIPGEDQFNFKQQKQGCESVYNKWAERNNESYTCLERITFMNKVRGLELSAAMQFVANEFPNECGPCGAGTTTQPEADTITFGTG